MADPRCEDDVMGESDMEETMVTELLREEGMVEPQQQRGWKGKKRRDYIDHSTPVSLYKCLRKTRRTRRVVLLTISSGVSVLGVIRRSSRSRKESLSRSPVLKDRKSFR